tara:strand:+ start:204 stop:611 length:408 start_codon:yes stop_codon:yes gene_type:complete
MERLVKKFLILTTVLGLAATAPAFANGKGNGNGNGDHRAERVANPSNGRCPPGLAKKDPPCIPPGQARKMDRDDDDRGHYRVGDRLDRDYVIIDRRDYGLPRLNDGEAYVRAGDRLLRLDRDQRLVLDILDVVLN